MASMRPVILLLALLLCRSCLSWGAEAESTPPDILKTDLLFVGAHPDDETGIASTLARYALAENKVVGCVYATRGEGGGNMAGAQWGAALGILREAELKNCLNRLGVRHLCFLDKLDWAYTESLSATLRKWGHEDTLELLVRVIRSLRPEIVVTMNPAPTPGQHGHHQAAGVLATEAFDAAADPARFPDQLEREGLSAWQARKLYYGGQGTNSVAIANDQPLPGGKTPGEIAGEALSWHRSQGFGGFARSPWLRRPQSFLLARSAVAIPGPERDLFDNTAHPVFVAAPRVSPVPEGLQITFAPRPAVARYQEWTVQTRTEQTAARLGADIPVVAGRPNTVKLLVREHPAAGRRGPLDCRVLAGWLVEGVPPALELAPGQTAEIQLTVTPPAGARLDAEISAQFAGAGAVAKLHPVPLGFAQAVSAPPGSDGYYDLARLPEHAVTTNLIVQGSVANPEDSSGTFKVCFTRTALVVQVAVLDQTIVSNIQPNDIKGHWRSDSVEICVDPVGGSEDTFGSYKLGIFPFDSAGHVRGARDADANQGPVERTAPGTRLLSKKTARGYFIQAEIPFTECGLDPRPGAEFGFNIMIYDGDKSDAAPGENINKSRLAWSPRSGVQGRPEDWGRLRFQ